jgi:cyclomaltodextrinase
LHQSLIALRRRHPWLHRARTRQVHLANAQLVLAMMEASQTLFVALNLADEPVSLPVPEAQRIEVGEGQLVSDAGGVRVSLKPQGWAILTA